MTDREQQIRKATERVHKCQNDYSDAIRSFNKLNITDAELREHEMQDMAWLTWLKRTDPDPVCTVCGNPDAVMRFDLKDQPWMCTDCYCKALIGTQGDGRADK